MENNILKNLYSSLKKKEQREKRHFIVSSNGHRYHWADDRRPKTKNFIALDRSIEESSDLFNGLKNLFSYVNMTLYYDRKLNVPVIMQGDKKRFLQVIEKPEKQFIVVNRDKEYIITDFINEVMWDIQNNMKSVVDEQTYLRVMEEKSKIFFI